MKLRVATYNIRKSVGLDWRRRPERILAVLQELDADVVALQEVDRRLGSRRTSVPEQAIEAAGWRVAHFPRRHEQSLGWRGNVILFRPPIALEAARGVELPAFEPRGMAMADLAVGGIGVRVVGMHLGLTGGPRLRQIAAILSEVEETPHRPTILMGDTNEWRALTGTLTAFGERHHLSSPVPTFHTSLPVAPLDRVVTTRDIRILSCGAHVSASSKRASDHLPLWAELELPRA